MNTNDLLLADLTKKASEIITKLKRHEVNSLVPNNEQLIRFEGISLDYSRQLINHKILTSLTKLDQIKNFKKEVAGLLSGKEMALHTVFRQGEVGFIDEGADTRKQIEKQFFMVQELCKKLENGEKTGWTNDRFENVIFLGLGGSMIPQKFVHKALKNKYQTSRLKFGFFSNPDGLDLCEYLMSCNARTTFFVLQSKSLKTPEIFFLFDYARKWLHDHGCSKKGEFLHFSVVTSNPKSAKAKGFPNDHIFEIPEKLGGRFSIWSAMGLSLALMADKENFDSFRIGAKNMDQHFYKATILQNLPIIMALISVWNRTFLNFTTQLIVNYSSALDNLVPYLQQLEMESLGKSINKEGVRVSYPTSGIIWGGSGFDAQHAYFQLLHQGTDIVPTTFVEVLEDKAETNSLSVSSYTKENIRAQADALAMGSPLNGFDGNRPSSIISINGISPYNLGALMALMEHKVFVQSVFWNLNCFDQPGVELGKQLLSSKVSNFNEGI